ncbi:MAG: hypothetical protein U0269_32650 [Polyangiales bacterium]
MLTAESVSFVVQRFGFERRTLPWLRVTGVVDGVELWMETSSQNSAYATVLANRRRGSDIGLRVSPSSMWVGAELFSSGDAQFDGIFSRSCAIGCEEQARAMLTTDVRADLSALARVGTGALYDDAACAWVVPSQLSGEELEHVLRTVAHLSVVADDATALLAPPKRLVESGVAAAIQAFASERALSLQGHPLLVRGALGEDDFTLRVLEHSSYRNLLSPLHGGSSDPGFDVALRFAEPLRGALRARPASLVDRAQAMLGVGDIETGDAEFDRTFTLDATVANDPERAAATQLVREQLNAEARRRLMVLARAKVAVSFDERGLIARGPRISSAQLALELLSAIAELRGAMRGDATRGPYR